MGAIANLVLSDGAATPVAHTFAPLNVIGDVATYVDRATGITIGYPMVKITITQPTKALKLTKVRTRVTMPVLEVLTASTYNGITPAPTKAYDLTFDSTFFLPERSTLQNRKDILAYAKNYLASSLVSSIIQDQESIY